MPFKGWRALFELGLRPLIHRPASWWCNHGWKHSEMSLKISSWSRRTRVTPLPWPRNQLRLKIVWCDGIGPLTWMVFSLPSSKVGSTIYQLEPISPVSKNRFASLNMTLIFVEVVSLLVAALLFIAWYLTITGVPVSVFKRINPSSDVSPLELFIGWRSLC